MRKYFVVIFVLILTLSMTSLVLAQENKLAFFKIDSDLATEGYQGGRVVEGIGGGQRVGFAVYVKNVDQLRLINVDFNWDGTKAEKAAETGYTISIDDRTINGVNVMASEDNVLVDVAEIIVADETGQYNSEIAKKGGDAIATEDYGMAYILVLKTDDGFTVGDSFTVSAKINVRNNEGLEKKLGERTFYVNGIVDVKTSTWGEIKSQYKDY